MMRLFCETAGGEDEEAADFDLGFPREVGAGALDGDDMVDMKASGRDVTSASGIYVACVRVRGR